MGRALVTDTQKTDKTDGPLRQTNFLTEFKLNIFQQVTSPDRPDKTDKDIRQTTFDLSLCLRWVINQREQTFLTPLVFSDRSMQ